MYLFIGEPIFFFFKYGVIKLAFRELEAYVS